MTLRDKVAHYRKAVVAGVGSVLMILTSVLALGDVLPSGVAVGVTTVVGLLTTFQVWLLKNATLIDDAAGAADDLYGGFRGGIESRGQG